MTEAKVDDKLKGMAAISGHLGVSEVTVLKWQRECGLPIRKAGGIWVGSRRRLDDWFGEYSGRGDGK